MDNWARKARVADTEGVPWTPFRKKIEESRLALITTGGVHLKEQPAFDMFDPGGDPSFQSAGGMVCSVFGAEL